MRILNRSAFQVILALVVFLGMAILLMHHLFTGFYMLLVGSLGIWAFWELVESFAKGKTTRALTFFLVSSCGIILTFGILYSDVGVLSGQGIGQQELLRGISVGLYFSVVTWTNLGYGDLQPLPTIRWVAALESIFGYVFMGILVSLTFRLLAEMANKNKQN